MRLHQLAAMAALATMVGPAGSDRLILDAVPDPWGGRRPSRYGLTSGLTRNGGRSKYEPHYGNKERGRWEGKRLS
jgi:hypothetical protein